MDKNISKYNFILKLSSIIAITFIILCVIFRQNIQTVIYSSVQKETDFEKIIYTILTSIGTLVIATISAIDWIKSRLSKNARG